MPIILESPTGTGGGGSGTVTNVSSANTGIVIANPTTTPTLTLATLDVIAADGPPAANWSNNSKKITSLAAATSTTDAASLANTLDQFAAPAADISLNTHKITNLTNGAGAQDAAAFGQIPTALPPNGSAGGDLTGTYPNPTVAAGAVTATKIGSIPHITEFQPSDHGLLGANGDPIFAAANNGAWPAGNGVLYLAKIWVPFSITVNSIWLRVTGNTTGVSGQNFAGIYDSSGSKIGATADQTTAWGTAGTKQMSTTAGVSITGGASTFVWAVLLANASSLGNVGTIIGVSQDANQTNINLTAATARVGTILTAQTTLPNSFTPASITLGLRVAWLGFS